MSKKVIDSGWKNVHNKNTVNACSGRKILKRLICQIGRVFSGIAFGKQERGGKGVVVFILCIFLYGAGWTDLCCGKVKNWWLFAGAVLGIWLRGSDFLLAAAAVLIPAYLLFRLRMMGAGDGKLMALIAGYLGLEPGMQAIGAGMAVGAVWSLCRIWHDKALLSRFIYLNAYIGRIILTKEIIHYQRFDSGEALESKEFLAPEYGRPALEGQSLLQKQKIVYGQSSAGKSRHTIPLAACLAFGTYLYLLFSCAMVVGKEIL